MSFAKQITPKSRFNRIDGFDNLLGVNPDQYDVIATEGEAFTADGIVKYGYGGDWITKTVNGEGICSNEFFGSDPSPGNKKSCIVFKKATQSQNNGGIGAYLPQNTGINGNATNTAPPKTVENNPKKGLGTGAIIGISIGGLILLTGIGLLIRKVIKNKNK